MLYVGIVHLKMHKDIAGKSQMVNLIVCGLFQYNLKKCTIFVISISMKESLPFLFAYIEIITQAHLQCSKI